VPTSAEFRRRSTLLAVPLTRAAPPLATQVRAAMAAGAQLVELRLDLVRDVGAVEELLGAPRIVPVILTIRAEPEGGAWTGSDEERCALLARLGSLRPGFIDVELAAWRHSAALRATLERVCAAPGRDAWQIAADAAAPGADANGLILSRHDVHGTPADMEAVFDELRASPAHVVKAAFTAQDARDAFRVLAELGRVAPERPTVAIAMGEAGLASRVLARKFGAFLSFATLEPGGASAPGQPEIHELRARYRWNEVDQATAVYGVIGWPVAHSRSPLLHNAGMQQDGFDGVYLPLPTLPSAADFNALLDYVTREVVLDVRGLSVTVPHKEHAYRWLQDHGGQITPAARACGAVNTLIRTSAGWSGDNTDVAGVTAALASAPQLAEPGLGGRRVLILGAGGIARAVVVALREHGTDITLCSRTAERARALAQELRCHSLPWAEREQLQDVDVLVNCTPVGMWPDSERSPIAAKALRPGMLVLDTIYTPPMTRLLRIAEERGCSVVGGEALFIGQAAAQYALWHQRRAPLALFRRLLER